jgi:hypothetical protein
VRDFTACTPISVSVGCGTYRRMVLQEITL